MPQSPFVHLHCHSHYSLLDGANRVPELVAHVKKLGMNACAITDHGNLFGAIEFYRDCKAAGINPDHRLRSLRRPRQTHRARGQEARRGRLSPDAARQERDRLQEPHQDGQRSPSWRAITTSRASTRNCSPTISEGLICLSGCASSRVQRDASSRTRWTRRSRLCAVVRQAVRQGFLRRGPEQRPRHSAAVRRGGHRHRQPAGPAAGRHLRRPLPDARGRPGP